MERDRKAQLDSIYREYAEPVYKYLYSLCRDSQTAEELTQETFCRAVKSIDRYDGSCRLFTWLCQIAKHTWYKELEKGRRRVPLEESVPGESDLAAETEEAEERIRLYRAVQKLGAPARDVVYLRLTGELSFREIGDILSMSENAARVTFYRAKLRLTEILKGEDKNG